MFGSAILEVAIGIIFVYLLVAIICSSIREGIESFLKSRAANLEYGIRQLLHDETGKGLARSFYNHPLINSLFAATYEGAHSVGKPGTFASGRNLPSYIPARNFALALMDIAARGHATGAQSASGDSPRISLSSVRETILNIGNPPVQRALLTAIDSAQGNLDRAISNIQNWYDSGMDRVSGWYKRSTQKILFGVGFVIAVAMNINTITLVDYLYRNDAARAALVARAEAAAQDTTLRNSGNYVAARAALDSLSLPIGWKNGIGTKPQIADAAFANLGVGQKVWYLVFAPVLGWLMTAFAAAMGAPFWFDLLNKIMVIRSTVKPHEKSPEESSEDRQSSKDKALQSTTPTPTPTPTPPPPPVQPPAGQPQAGQPPPDVTPPLIVPTSSAPHEHEDDVDACDVDLTTDTTSDEDLPAATGGVA